MTQKMNTRDLDRKNVWIPKPKKNIPDAIKRVGRVHHFVFHPSRAQFVGFLVKRPDIALMFHRKDLFVPLGGFDIVGNGILLRSDIKTLRQAQVETYGIDPEVCVIWAGLAVCCSDGTTLGLVDDIEFDLKTGRVIALNVDNGAVSGALLGRYAVPGDMVRGFTRGMGTQLYLTDNDDPDSYGCILVDDEALNIEAEGGLAARAGEATAIATHTAKKTYRKAARKVKPVVEGASRTVGEAIQKGAYATGRQIARTEGMFTNFKKEFKKAVNNDR